MLIGGYSRKNHIKGGVAGYVRHDLEKQTKLICISGDDTELICETALFEIKLKKTNLYILGVYRPPNANLDSAIDILAEQLDKTLDSDKNIVVMGDINVDNLTENNDKLKLDELLTSYQITRMSLPPTRLTIDTSKSIDWICTNMNYKQIHTSVISSGLSDHTAQTVTIAIQKIKENIRENKRVFNKKAIEMFKARLQNQNWDHLYVQEDTNKAYDTFHNILQLILDETCPIKSFRTKQNKNIRQCWDSECTKLKNDFLQALERAQRTGKFEDKLEMAAKKKKYDTKLKKLRKEKMAEHIDGAENKSKALWQAINNERKAKTSSNTQLHLKTNNTLITDPIDVANCFNDFFSTIADRTLQNTINLNPNLDEYEPPPPIEQNLIFERTTVKEILKIIDSLKPKTSSGIDQISSKLIKHCKEELLSPLTFIFNKSLAEGTFPNQLKIAKVYPKYKTGPTNEINSYRPISLISTFSKILEKIVLHRLLNHLQQNKLLTDKQHGFLKGRSTATALIQMIEYIIDRLEEGCTAACLFLDFSKAFDCLNHDQLLRKLESLGIRRKTQNWFRSYLTGRKMLVEINCTENNTIQNVQSRATHVNRGVPQGSVLGPVLFLLLTNDMPNWLGDTCHTVMYADDTALTIANKSINTLQENITTSYNKTKNYCSKNDLVLNEKKTVQMIFSNLRRNPDVTLPDLETKDNTKHLGIIIDNKLTWKPQIDQLCKKLSASNYVIRRMMQISGLDTARVAYFALFESYLRYGITIWGGSSKNNLERLLINQKRAIRCLAGLNYRDSCREHFINLNILTVISLYIRETILHAVKTSQKRHSDLHNHNTRHATDFTLPPHHLSLYKKKPSYKGAAYYNHLPEHLKNQPPQLFKRKLTLWLQERPFYTEQEFITSRWDNDLPLQL